MFGMNIMKQVQQMQEKIAALTGARAGITLPVYGGGGMVTVTCNGKQEILGISIDKALVEDGDVTMIEDLVLTAVNDALTRSRELMSEEMRALTGGISIPGLS